MNPRSIPLVAAILVGCTDAGVVLDAPAHHASTPDETVLFARRAYASRNPALLDPVLSSDFRFELHPIDADSLRVAAHWNRDEEIAIARRLFGDEAGVRVDGSCQPPLDDDVGLQITFDDAPFVEATRWEPVESGELRGTLRRRYGATGQLLDARGLLDFIRGLQEIHVRLRRIEVDGHCCAEIYEIVRWRDLGVASAKKHGNFSWGRIKARWRTGAPIPSDCPPP